MMTRQVIVRSGDAELTIAGRAAAIVALVAANATLIDEHEFCELVALCGPRRIRLRLLAGRPVSLGRVDTHDD